MIDIISATTDIGLFDTQTTKAANILSIQLGALEYAPDLGVDLKYFLSDEFKFQNESFKSYLVQRLADSSINVSSVAEVLNALYSEFDFNVTPSQANSSLIAR